MNNSFPYKKAVRNFSFQIHSTIQNDYFYRRRTMPKGFVCIFQIVQVNVVMGGFDMKESRFQSRLIRWVILSVLAVSLSVLLPVAAQDESEEYTVGVQMVAEGMSAPVAMASAHDGRLFVV